MKGLVFSGLVLGSVVYLVATQSSAVNSDFVHQWLDEVQPQAQEIVSSGEQQLERALEAAQPVPGAPAIEAALIQELKASIIELQDEIKQLKANVPSVLPEPLPSSQQNTDVALQPQSRDLVVEDVSADPLLQIQAYHVPENQVETLAAEAEKMSPYMRVEERSEALMALVYRMEMKAAGY